MDKVNDKERKKYRRYGNTKMYFAQQEDFLASGGEFDEDLFASAKSTALFEVVEYEKCPADVVRISLFNYVRSTPDDYNKSVHNQLNNNDTKLSIKLVFLR